MQIQKLIRSDENFYRIMGPFFGSRQVEHVTHDRFYDDPGKVWYTAGAKGAASVLNSEIRNFYAADQETAEALLSVIERDYRFLSGIVPRRYREAFVAHGFSARDYRTNFLEVEYEAD